MKPSHLFLYPAHDVNNYLVIPAPAYYLLQASAALKSGNPQQPTLAEEVLMAMEIRIASAQFYLSRWYTTLTAEPEWLEEPECLRAANNFLCGITLTSHDINTWQQECITAFLVDHGFKITPVDYGSPEHKEWNTYVGD